jgi:hypothetical protein
VLYALITVCGETISLEERYSFTLRMYGIVIDASLAGTFNGDNNVRQS